MCVVHSRRLIIWRVTVYSFAQDKLDHKVKVQGSNISLLCLGTHKHKGTTSQGTQNSTIILSTQKLFTADITSENYAENLQLSSNTFAQQKITKKPST
jgi:hypothetical protein